MNLSETVIEGTLKPDGTLELDEKPNLSPGRVQIIMQPLSKPAATKRGLVEVMDEIRASQRARGYMGQSLEAMQAEENVRQEEEADYEQRCEQLWGGPLPPSAKKE
jgi:cell pole-organizing protein PopZ